MASILIFKKSNIRVKLISLLLSASVLLLVFLYGIYYWSNIKISDTVKKRSEDFQLALEQNIHINTKRLQAVVIDFTLWDQMFDIVSDPYPAWFEENIDYSAPLFGVENYWLVNNSGEISYQFSKEDNALPLPFTLSQLQAMDLNSGLNSFYLNNNNEQQIIEILAMGIHRSADDHRLGPIAGWFVIARSINDDYINKLEAQLNAQVKLHIDKSHNPSSNNDWQLVSQHQIFSIDKQAPIATFEAQINIGDLKQLSDSILLIFILFIICLVIFISITYIFLGLIIINPILAMNRALELESSKPIESYMDDENEIGRLSQLIIKFHLQRQLLADDVKRKEAELEDKEQLNQVLFQASRTDQLTQLRNRRGFDEYFELCWKASISEQTDLAIILIDIDFFKLYNDNYGHQKGDTVLESVAKIIASEVHRPSDLAARYGGEEFVVICPHTDIIGATALAERIRTSIFDACIEHAHSKVAKQITLSIGVACFRANAELSHDKLISSADICLYKAKETGRNCVVSQQ